MRRYAIVITGILRSLETTIGWFNSLPENCDLFIVTDAKSRKKLDQFQKLKDHRIIEDSAYQNSVQEYLLSIREGSKILQWQKFAVAVEMIEEYSKNNRIHYAAVYKVRTDLIGLDSLEFRETSNDTIYMTNDFAFASSQEKIAAVGKFFMYCLSCYGRNHEYHNIDYKTLQNADRRAGKFPYLNYPDVLIGEQRQYFDFDALLTRIIYKNAVSLCTTGCFALR